MKRKKSNFIRYIFGLIIVIALVGGGFLWSKKIHRTSDLRNSQLSTPTLSNEQEVAPSSVTSVTPAPDQASTATQAEQLPNRLVLPVQFLSQAPFANWDALHEDACEEASLVMVHHYYTKTKITSLEQGDAEIKDLVAYEEQNDYGTSITLKRLSVIAAKQYDMTTGRIEMSVTVENIKKELASGHPVIVPAAGKILPNPNFKNGGPNYHMLVIVGYENGEFITNDPGTRKGEGFRYTYDALINAIRDWDSSNILNGHKAYLVFD